MKCEVSPRNEKLPRTGWCARFTNSRKAGQPASHSCWNDWLMLQPCAALQGKRCGIYAHRPECCRTFECRLLQDVRHGTVGVARAREHIAGALKQVGLVRKLAAALGQRDARLPLKERCAEALAPDDGAGADPDTARQRAKLETAMKAVERTIRKTFLRGSGPV